MSYVLGALEDGLGGLLLVLAPIPLLFFLASRRHSRYEVLLSVCPGLVIAALFIWVCVVSHWTTGTTFDTTYEVYTILLVVALVLVVPATGALRRKWFGLLHVATGFGAAYLWFIGGMALAHDWL